MAARLSLPEGLSDLLRRSPALLEAGHELLEPHLETVDFGLRLLQLGQQCLVERHPNDGSRLGDGGLGAFIVREA